MTRKPWQSKEWKKKRDEILKTRSKCEWCNSTKKLTIDHLHNWNGLMEWNKIAIPLFYSYFKNGVHKEELLKYRKASLEGIEIRYSLCCPKCNRSVYERKTVKPKYRCVNCGFTTDKAKKKVRLATIRFLNKRIFSLWAKDHKEEIDSLFQKRKKKANESYLNFEEILVLCNKCAYARRKGMALCKVCKQKYHKSRYRSCWQCFIKTDEGKLVLKRREEEEYDPFIT